MFFSQRPNYPFYLKNKTCHNSTFHDSNSLPHRSVVVDHDALHGLDEPPLDVAGLRGLDGGIDQALAAAHGVEVELGRS